MELQASPTVPLADDPNRPETEEDGYRAGELRVAKLLRNNPQKRDEALARMRSGRESRQQQTSSSNEPAAKSQALDEAMLREKYPYLFGEPGDPMTGAMLAIARMHNEKDSEQGETGMVAASDPLHEKLQALPEDKMLELIRVRTRPGSPSPSEDRNPLVSSAAVSAATSAESLKPCEPVESQPERRVIGHRRYPVGGQFNEPALLDKLDPKFWEAAPEAHSMPSWKRWLTRLRKLVSSVFRSR